MTRTMVLEDWYCEHGACKRAGVTWCPLCRKMLCREHDELTPRRMHDCLAGPADE